MRTILLTVARRGPRGAGFSPEARRRVESALAVPIWLNRTDERRDSWVARSGTVRLDVITNEPPATGPLIARYPSGNAAAWNGYIDDPSFQADRPDPATVAGLPGSFALVAAFDEGADVFTCVSGLDPLYVAEGPEVLVVSSSARAAHAAAGITATAPPLAALIGLTGPGRMVNEITPFPGVVTVPGDVRLAVGPTGLTMTPLPGPDIDPDAPVAEVADRFIEALLAAAGAVGRLGVPVTSHLTGGRDSRLVAAALAAAGVDFTTLTLGVEEDPDVRVAAMVALALGVDHTVRPDESVDESGLVSLDLVRRAYRMLRGCEGMVSCYDFGGFRSDSYSVGTINVGGELGEHLRGGHGGAIGRNLNPARPLQHMRERILSRVAPHYGLLAPPARECLDEILAPWEAQFRHDAFRAGLLLGTQLWAGRWLGVLRSGRSIDGPSRELLTDNQLVRIARAVDQRQAAEERLVHAAIHRLAPRLCQVPFLGSRWTFEEAGPVSECTPDRWERRAPVPASSGTAWEWREEYPPQLQHHFIDTIMAAPLFGDLLDRDATARLLTAGLSPHRTRMNAKTAWALYTASHLVAGLGTQPVEPESPLIEFSQPPAPARSV